jgi:hypothetical protein
MAENKAFSVYDVTTGLRSRYNEDGSIDFFGPTRRRYGEDTMPADDPPAWMWAGVSAPTANNESDN